jgi:hypothetical protein
MKMTKLQFCSLSFTWGIVMTAIGIIVAIALLITGHRPKKWGYCFYFEVGSQWGGVSFGPVFLVQKNGGDNTKSHEHGHACQNCIYGPLMVCISIASAIRYWYREFAYNRKGLQPPTSYDDAWYEGQATKFGTDLMEHLEQ